MMGDYYIDIRPISIEASKSLSLSQSFLLAFCPLKAENNVHINNNVGKVSTYVPVFLEPNLRFAYVVSGGERYKYRVVNISRKPTVVANQLVNAIQEYKQNLLQIKDYKETNKRIVTTIKSVRS